MSDEHKADMADERGLAMLLAWLEYGKESGYKAARCSEKQEKHWGVLLRQMMAEMTSMFAVCDAIDALDFCEGYTLPESELPKLWDALTLARDIVKKLRGKP